MIMLHVIEENASDRRWLWEGTLIHCVNGPLLRPVFRSGFSSGMHACAQLKRAHERLRRFDKLQTKIKSFYVNSTVARGWRQIELGGGSWV
jgi:hypothetical protein